jgi:hypothetical protein
MVTNKITFTRVPCYRMEIWKQRPLAKVCILGWRVYHIKAVNVIPPPIYTSSKWKLWIPSLRTSPCLHTTYFLLRPYSLLSTSSSCRLHLRHFPEFCILVFRILNEWQQPQCTTGASHMFWHSGFFYDTVYSSRWSSTVRKNILPSPSTLNVLKVRSSNLVTDTSLPELIMVFLSVQAHSVLDRSVRPQSPFPNISNPSLIPNPAIRRWNNDNVV